MEQHVVEEKQEVQNKPNEAIPTPDIDAINDNNNECKEIETNNNIAPKRESMSPESKSNSIINSCAVLIIPLDNRVTPQMVANKFVKYGKILQVRPIKKSSSCIVIFPRASEATNCIRLFEKHDKVRVTRPQKRDWKMCDDSIAIQNNAYDDDNNDIKEIESKRINNEKEEINNKIATYETQESRITIMYAQRHAYQMLHENDEIVARKRVKNNELLINRIQTMYKTSNELYLYLREMMDLEIKHEEHIHKLIIENGTFALHENGGSVHSAGIAINALNKNRYQQFNDINNRVFKHILLSAHKYQNTLKRKMHYFQNRIAKFDQKINQSKTNFIREWNKYQNILNRTLKLQANKNKQDNNYVSNEIDPFLAGKSYFLAQNEYKISLNEYNEEMSRLFNSIIMEDKKRIDGIKSILIDYFLAQKAKALNHVKLIESSLEYIKSVDKEQDTNDFMKRFAHIQRETDTNDENKKKTKAKKKDKKTDKDEDEDEIIFDFSETETFSLHSTELTRLIFTDVIKKGIIYRQRRILSANWKAIHANVTKFGFFHAFENKQDTKAAVSIALQNTTINIKDCDKQIQLFTFEIIVPNASWFSLTGTPTKYIYKIDEYKDFVEWIQYLKKFAMH